MIRLLLCGLLALSVTNAFARQPFAFVLQGDVAGAHDPAIIHAGRTWYVFTTGKAADGGQLGIRCSEDLIHWRHCGHVFDHLPPWITERSPATRDLWAPDISYEHGQYRLYYAYSLFGKNTSGIALATNDSLDPQSSRYQWKDRGLVFESKREDDYNAIDPSYIEDTSHRAWLCFGSFWSGIKLIALDPKTGARAASDSHVYSIAARARPVSAAPDPPGLPGNWQAIEAPFLFHHDRFYFLFVSFDLCCRGTKSTYRTMVGRSTAITGPYVDRDGVPLSNGGGTALLTANERWLGPGGQSVIAAGRGKPDLIVYHAYDHTTGKPSLQLSTMDWQDGWPAAAVAH